MVYGYARCSTNEERQDIDRQKRELFALGVEKDKYIYWEYESGAKTERTEFNKLLDLLAAGDSVVVTEVSRLTRSTKHLCEILQIIQDKKVVLNIGGSFIVDCSKGEIDPMTEGMIKMWGVFAEMERNMISQRVKSGMKNAAAKGKVIGRPELTVEGLPDKFWKYYQMYKEKQINVTEFARMLGCSRGTVYRYMKVWEETR